jgi:hypothetical protein
VGKILDLGHKSGIYLALDRSRKHTTRVGNNKVHAFSLAGGAKQKSRLAVNASRTSIMFPVNLSPR